MLLKCCEKQHFWERNPYSGMCPECVPGLYKLSKTILWVPGNPNALRIRSISHLRADIGPDEIRHEIHFFHIFEAFSLYSRIWTSKGTRALNRVPFSGKLDKDLIKMDKNKSGICHHMIFETKYIDELISKIEKNHNDLFYNVFLKLITVKEGSGASEYEIYFNYMLKYSPTNIKIRTLNWENTNNIQTNNNLDYLSYHWYMR